MILGQIFPLGRIRKLSVLKVTGGTVQNPHLGQSASSGERQTAYQSNSDRSKGMHNLTHTLDVACKVKTQGLCLGDEGPGSPD